MKLTRYDVVFALVTLVLLIAGVINHDVDLMTLVALGFLGFLWGVLARTMPASFQKLMLSLLAAMTGCYIFINIVL